MIKAIIYDLDGLIADSEPLHRQSLEVVLEGYGYKYDELPEDLRASFLGQRITDIFQKIIDYLDWKIELKVLIEKKRKVFEKLLKEELTPMPGLKSSLNLFKNYNFSIALASSGPREYINLVLEKFKISNYFDVIVAGDSVKKGKPDPESYLLTVSQLKLRPEECLVLEDSTNGIKSAKTAGCKCVAVINPDNFSQDYSQADLILNSLSEINSEFVSQLN